MKKLLVAILSITALATTFTVGGSEAKAAWINPGTNGSNMIAIGTYTETRLVYGPASQYVTASNGRLMVLKSIRQLAPNYSYCIYSTVGVIDQGLCG